MALTDTQIRNAKPKAKAYKLSDGGGIPVISPNYEFEWHSNVNTFVPLTATRMTMATKMGTPIRTTIGLP
jgi:hypothetical protein